MLLALWPSWLAPSFTLLWGSRPKGKGLFCGFQCGRVSQEPVYNFHSKAHLCYSHKESPFVVALHQQSLSEVSPQSPARVAGFSGPMSGNVKLEWLEFSLQIRVIICQNKHCTFVSYFGSSGTLRSISTECVFTAQQLVWTQSGWDTPRGWFRWWLGSI